MARVRTLTKTFLKGHPREGEPTFFVEQFLNSLEVDYTDRNYLVKLLSLNEEKVRDGRLTFPQIDKFVSSLDPNQKGKKPHTIRGGLHFQADDFIKLTVWNGVPYKDPQIILWDPVEVKATYPFAIIGGCYVLDGRKTKVEPDQLELIAKNDGLKRDDFECWFKNGFSGQVICWKPIKY